jgi:hypothetical protein
LGQTSPVSAHFRILSRAAQTPISPISPCLARAARFAIFFHVGQPVYSLVSDTAPWVQFVSLSASSCFILLTKPRIPILVTGIPTSAPPIHRSSRHGLIFPCTYKRAPGRVASPAEARGPPLRGIGGQPHTNHPTSPGHKTLAS